MTTRDVVRVVTQNARIKRTSFSLAFSSLNRDPHNRFEVWNTLSGSASYNDQYNT